MMKSSIVILLLTGLLVTTAHSQQASVRLISTEPGPVISRHIYGHFSEHLGRCIYDGFWVSDTSTLPRKDRIRLDIVEALKKDQDTEFALARRLLCRRISLARWNRPPRTTAEDDQYELGECDGGQQFWYT